MSARPLKSAAEQLRQQLARVLPVTPLAQLARGDLQLLERLNAVRQALGPARGHHALPRIAQGVLALRLLGWRTPYPDLKYACYGLARPTDWEGRLVLDDSRLCDELRQALLAVRSEHAAYFAACCRALRHAWKTDIADSATLGMRARENWQRLASQFPGLPPA